MTSSNQGRAPGGEPGGAARQGVGERPRCTTSPRLARAALRGLYLRIHQQRLYRWFGTDHFIWHVYLHGPVKRVFCGRFERKADLIARVREFTSRGIPVRGRFARRFNKRRLIGKRRAWELRQQRVRERAAKRGES